jgi:putative membrane protein
MKTPICTSACILSFALCLSLGALAGQEPPATSDKKPASTDKAATSSDKAAPSKDKTSTRNRVVEPSGSLVHPTDEKFMMDVARGGMMEVQLGQTAQQKASSAAVKEFGKKMEQDHTQAGSELAALAKSKNVSLPTDVGGEKAMMDKMSNLSGQAFDKAYVKAMVRDHRKDVKEFEREAADGIDSDVKAFAAKTLPTLKEHLGTAENLRKNPTK